MRFSVWPRPQQSWSSILSLAEQAESTGWDGIWFADHFMPNADDEAGRPLTDPVLECLTGLAGLAVAGPYRGRGEELAGRARPPRPGHGQLVRPAGHLGDRDGGHSLSAS